MTIDEATRRASKLTFDDDLAREIALLALEAAAIERDECAKLMTAYARKERDEKRVTAFADASDAIRARTSIT